MEYMIMLNYYNIWYIMSWCFLFFVREIILFGGNVILVLEFLILKVYLFICNYLF